MSSGGFCGSCSDPGTSPHALSTNHNSGAIQDLQPKPYAPMTVRLDPVRVIDGSPYHNAIMSPMARVPSTMRFPIERHGTVGRGQLSRKARVKRTSVAPIGYDSGQLPLSHSLKEITGHPRLPSQRARWHTQAMLPYPDTMPAYSWYLDQNGLLYPSDSMYPHNRAMYPIA